MATSPLGSQTMQASQRGVWACRRLECSKLRIFFFALHHHLGEVRSGSESPPCSNTARFMVLFAPTHSPGLSCQQLTSSLCFSYSSLFSVPLNKPSLSSPLEMLRTCSFHRGLFLIKTTQLLWTLCTRAGALFYNLQSTYVQQELFVFFLILIKYS